jgi:hypothetical protein
LRAVDVSLGRYWNCSRSGEREREGGKDAEVGVERNPVNTTDAERREAYSFFRRPNARSTKPR